MPAAPQVSPVQPPSPLSCHAPGNGNGNGQVPTQRWSAILVATTFALLSKWITAQFCGQGTSTCESKGF